MCIFSPEISSLKVSQLYLIENYEEIAKTNIFFLHLLWNCEIWQERDIICIALEKKIKFLVVCILIIDVIEIF